MRSIEEREKWRVREERRRIMQVSLMISLAIQVASLPFLASTVAYATMSQ